MQRLNAANVSPALLEKAQNRVIDAALTLIREKAKLQVKINAQVIIAYILLFIEQLPPIHYPLFVDFDCNFARKQHKCKSYFSFSSAIYIQGEFLRGLGGVVAASSLLGIPLGHNSSFHQGSAFAPPRIREAIWCDSTNSITEKGTYVIPLISIRPKLCIYIRRQLFGYHLSILSFLLMSLMSFSFEDDTHPTPILFLVNSFSNQQCYSYQ